MNNARATGSAQDLGLGPIGKAQESERTIGLVLQNGPSNARAAV